jgi:hypothetical protein
MAQEMMITSGSVEAARAEEFQVAFRTMVSERVMSQPYVQQCMLVHHGGGRWSVFVLVDGTLAQRTKPTHDVPVPVQVFRDFGVEPTIELVDVSIVFSAVAVRDRESPATGPSSRPRPADKGQRPPTNG